jgi:hypothetical protein
MDFRGLGDRGGTLFACPPLLSDRGCCCFISESLLLSEDCRDSCLASADSRLLPACPKLEELEIELLRLRAHSSA